MLFFDWTEYIDRHMFDHLFIASDFHVDFTHDGMNLHYLHTYITDLNLIAADVFFLFFNTSHLHVG